jgi:hypothetical protein
MKSDDGSVCTAEVIMFRNYLQGYRIEEGKNAEVFPTRHASK